MIIKKLAVLFVLGLTLAPAATVARAGSVEHIDLKVEGMT